MFYPPIERTLRPRDAFDPVREGARHGLSPELALAIWKRIAEDVTRLSPLGRMDHAPDQFHALAALGGQPPPVPGRRTRVESESEPEPEPELEPTAGADLARELASLRAFALAGANAPTQLEDALTHTFGAAARSIEILYDRPAPLGAEAFTTDQRVHVAPGNFEPRSRDGRVRLGHEVAHALQQRRGGARAGHLSTTERSALEAEAELAGHAFAVGRPFEVTGRAPAAVALYRGGPPEPGVSGATTSGADAETLQLLVTELRRVGPDEAKVRLRRADATGRPLLITAIRRAFPEQADHILEGSGEGDHVAPTPTVQAPNPTAPNPNPTANPKTQTGGHTGDQHQTVTAPTHNGAAPQLTTPPAEHAPAVAAKPLDQMSNDDLALISLELVEYQRWSGAMAHVGAAGSVDRAEFIADQAGQGAIHGGATGLAIGFGMGAVAKLAQRFVPVPGVGAILGGGMAAYNLATRDWGATAATIHKFGQGADTYETIANSIAAVSEVIDVITHILNVIAGIIGVISAVMWLVTILTVGVAAPLAATLSSIALGIGAATMVIDGINNLVLQPCVLLFRALHTFKSQADPSQVEAEGAGISDAAQRAAGMLGGLVGAKAGEHAGDRAGGQIQARINARAAGATKTTPVAEQQPTTQEQETAPQEQETAPQEQETAPQEQEHPPQEQEHPPQEQETAPQEQETAPQEQPHGTKVTDSPLSKSGDTFEVERRTVEKAGAQRTYRRIELRDANGKVLETREEILDTKGRWRRRGSEAVSQGKAGEEASQRMTDRQVANPPEGTKVVAVDTQNAQGHGFDQVVLRLNADGTAEVHVLEVKDYNGQVPGSEMTAVRDNLQTNLEALSTRVSENYEEMGLTEQQRDAVLEAIADGRIQITPRIGPRTRLATKQDGTLLNDLQTSLQERFGPNITVNDPERIPPEFYNPVAQNTAPPPPAVETPVAETPVAETPVAETTGAETTGAETPEPTTGATKPRTERGPYYPGPRDSATAQVPPPPASLQQIQQMQAQIDAILQARMRAEAAAAVMGEERSTAQSHTAPIQGLVQQGQHAMTAAQAHQQIVAARTAANQEQQRRQQQAQGLIGQYPTRAAGLGVLKVPLRAFQGFTWIAGKLPGKAGAAMRRMNDDANRMNAAFDQMGSAMAQQGQSQPQHAQQLRGDATRLRTTSVLAGNSQRQLQTSARGGQALQQANQASLAQASAAQQEARSDSATLAAQAQAKQQQRQALTAQLRAWALAHRQARLARRTQGS